MTTQRIFVMALAALSLVLAVSLASVTDALADPPGEWTYLVATPGVGLCSDPPAPSCPAEAMAENGDIIQLFGFGMLTLGPKSADGGGLFTYFPSAGDSVDGTWVAKELLSFHSYGPSPVLPQIFEAGRAQILVELEEVAPGVGGLAILGVECRLPEVKQPPATIEGIRLTVLDGLNFNEGIQPRATLFIRLD